MHLTPAQIVTLRNFISADQSLNAVPNTTDGALAIADALNVAASPAFVVWRSSVDTSEIMSAGFVWTEVDNLSVGKSRIWEWMAGIGTINPSRQGVRDGLVACFGAASATTTATLPLLKRNATRAEKLFATGVGSVGVPATMAVEGKLDADDILTARSA